MTKHEELAHELHRQGYSCAQAVAAAFSDLAGLDRATLLKLTAGFGGGIADLREICGAVSGAMMALDLIYAEGAPNKQARSQNDYPRLQALAGNAFHLIDFLLMSGQMLICVFEFCGEGHESIVHRADLRLDSFHFHHFTLQGLDTLLVAFQHNFDFFHIVCSLLSLV
jgi:hypothetical protein